MIYVDEAPGGVTPAVPGIPNDRWGLTWVKVAPGEQHICFGDAFGHTTPDCVDVVVVAGEVLEVVGDYTPEAIVRVDALGAPAGTSPTISLNGVPRDAWQVWTSVPAGDYEVCFGDVPGATAPPCQNVTFVVGANLLVTGTYTVP